MNAVGMWLLLHPEALLAVVMLCLALVVSGLVTLLVFVHSWWTERCRSRVEVWTAADPAAAAEMGVTLDYDAGEVRSER